MTPGLKLFAKPKFILVQSPGFELRLHNRDISNYHTVLEIIFHMYLHMYFQIFLLVGHLTNWTGHNLLTDKTLKKRTQDVLLTCSVIVSDHNVKLAGHFQNLVGQCLMADCYFQHCRIYAL